MGVFIKFRDGIQAGDVVITYNPELRVYYLLGTMVGAYQFCGNDRLGDEYPHIRPVQWLGSCLVTC